MPDNETEAKIFRAWERTQVKLERLRARARAVVEAFQSDGSDCGAPNDPRTPSEGWWKAVYPAIDALAAELEAPRE